MKMMMIRPVLMFSSCWSTWSDILDRLPATMQFSILVVGVCVFFGLHNLLQEAIMVQMGGVGHQFGVMLGYTEVLGVTIGAYIERHYIVRERGRTAPLTAFTLLTCCLLTSSALSNISLNYINFPTKVHRKQCVYISLEILLLFATCSSSLTPKKTIFFSLFVFWA
jgi:hypothetical protein